MYLYRKCNQISARAFIFPTLILYFSINTQAADLAIALILERIAKHHGTYLVGDNFSNSYSLLCKYIYKPITLIKYLLIV